MLPRAQAPRLLVPRRLQWQAHRKNSTTAEVKRYRQESSTFAADRHKLPVLKAPEQAAFVKTARFLESPVQALAVIRAVERKYGAVNEYYIAKDFEVGTRYQSIIHLQFKDPESFNRVPASNDGIFHVATPDALNRPGGVGLDELEMFLERQEYVNEVSMPAFGSVMDSVLQNGRDEAENKNMNIMECKIARSKNAFWTPSSSPPALTTARDVTGRNFIKWGGFQTLKPIEKGTPILDDELFGSTSLDHVRMRRTLRKWSTLSGAPNPYEYSEESETLTQNHQTMPSSIQESKPQKVVREAQLDLDAWEPLPGYESELEDPPVSDPAPMRLVKDATSSPTRSIPSTDTSKIPPLLPKTNYVGKEDPPGLLPSLRHQILTETISSFSPQPNTTGKTTTHSLQAEKAAQLKAARAAANVNKSPHKKIQRSKPPVKGPVPLPKKPQPVSPSLIQEEKQDGGVAARWKRLFGF